MNDPGASSTMDLSFFSDEPNFQTIEDLATKVETDQPIKRKRGRPRTRIPPPVQYDENGNPIKKQRGRPRKDPSSASSKQSQSIVLFDENGIPLKKRRGRPRKSLIDPTTISFSLETVEDDINSNKPVLGLGSKGAETPLPSSHIAIGNAALIASIPIQPKKRGRPKKIQGDKFTLAGETKKEEDEKMRGSEVQPVIKKKRGRPKKSEIKRETISTPDEFLDDTSFIVNKVPDNLPRYLDNPKKDKEFLSSIQDRSVQNGKHDITHSQNDEDNSSDPSFIPLSDNRKKLVQNNEAAKAKEPVTDIQETLPKKRGRPKKIADPNAPPKVKRPRGRPPKTISLQPISKNSNLSTDQSRPSSAGNLINSLKTTTEVEDSPKRKIKLSKGNQYHISNDSRSSIIENSSFKETESNKAIVFNFKKNQGKNTKTNVILDDSYDVFSFDNNGNSNFVIPEDVLPSQAKEVGTKEVNDLNLEPLKEKLELIDTDVEFSADDKSECSSQVGSPSVEDISTLRPLLDPIENSLEAADATKSCTSSKDNTSRNVGNNFDRKSENHITPLIPKVGTRTTFDNWSLSLSFQDMNDHGTSDISSNSEKEKIEHAQVPSSPNIPQGTNSVVKCSSISDATLPDASSNSEVEEFSIVPMLPKWSESPNELFSTLNGDILTLHHYFEDLLSYMNTNNSSLSNDIKGDLSFFINQMPMEELTMNFHEWLDSKARQMHSKFEMDVEQKVTLLKKNFEASKRLLEEIDDDSVLLKLARRFNIKY